MKYSLLHSCFTLLPASRYDILMKWAEQTDEWVKLVSALLLIFFFINSLQQRFLWYKPEATPPLVENRGEIHFSCSFSFVLEAAGIQNEDWEPAGDARILLPSSPFSCSFILLGLSHICGWFWLVVKKFNEFREKIFLSISMLDYGDEVFFRDRDAGYNNKYFDQSRGQLRSKLGRTWFK